MNQKNPYNRSTDIPYFNTQCYNPYSRGRERAEFSVEGDCNRNDTFVAEDPTVARFDAERVISLPQVHGTQVLCVTQADAGRGYFKPAQGASDGYMTAQKGLPLGVKSADCVPVLLEARDAQGQVQAVSAVHAGWRGTAGGIVVNAVSALRQSCGECEIYAAIGPCIGSCCFEVDFDCVDEFVRLCGREIVDACFTGAQNGKYYGDLVKVNRMLLHGVGVDDAHVDAANICTCCHPEQFFSHRYATKHQGGQRGTMLSVIWK